MIFLVDENLSPRLCEFLRLSNHGAEHVRDAVGAGATDQQVMDHAHNEGAVVVTADTDFGTLLARSGRRSPSVILVRQLLGLSITEQARLIVANLP